MKRWHVKDNRLRVLRDQLRIESDGAMGNKLSACRDAEMLLLELEDLRELMVKLFTGTNPEEKEQLIAAHVFKWSDEAESDDGG